MICTSRRLARPTWIWSVVLDGALYVRAYTGPKSAGIRPGSVAIGDDSEER